LKEFNGGILFFVGIGGILLYSLKQEMLCYTWGSLVCRNNLDTEFRHIHIFEKGRI